MSAARRPAVSTPAASALAPSALAASALAAVLLSGSLAVAGCRPHPPEGGPSPSAAAGSPAKAPADAAVAEGAWRETERLKEAGPSYTPYDRGPRQVWDDEAQRALVEVLAPVVEAQRLPVNTRTLVWTLVGPDGRVADAVVQTSSGNGAFDRASVQLAKRLRFRPATAEGGAIPVWVIREVSLMMQ